MSNLAFAIFLFFQTEPESAVPISVVVDSTRAIAFKLSYIVFAYGLSLAQRSGTRQANMVFSAAVEQACSFVRQLYPETQEMQDGAVPVERSASNSGVIAVLILGLISQQSESGDGISKDCVEQQFGFVLVQMYSAALTSTLNPLAMGAEASVEGSTMLIVVAAICIVLISIVMIINYKNCPISSI
jgi:hypothetical protein